MTPEAEQPTVSATRRDPRPAGRRAAVVALLVFLIVASASVIGWRVAAHHEAEVFRLETHASAEQIALRLEGYVTARFDLMRHLRDEIGHDEVAAHFVDHAAAVQRHFSGIVSINWIDADGVIRRVVPEEPNRAALGRDLTRHPDAAPILRAAADSDALRATAPLELYQGGRGFAAYLPVRMADGRLAGFVNAAFRLEPLIEDALASGVRDRFYFRIVDGTDPIYAFVPEDDRELARPDASVQVAVADRVWHVDLRAVDEAGPLGPVVGNEWFGAVGIVVAIGLGFMTYRLLVGREALGRSEARFRAIFGSVNDAIFIFDEHGRLLDVNPRACELYGMTPERLLTLEVADLATAESGDSRSRIRERFAAVADSGASDMLSWRAERPDGTSWWAEVHVRAASIAERRCVVAVARDVTERRELEDQLRHAQKLEAVGTLAGGVAHDFNNALTAIVGHAEIAQSLAPPGSPIARSLAGVQAACAQATGVTRSLLTFSRRSTTARVPVELRELVKATVDLLRPALPDAVRVVGDPGAREPVWVDADPTQLQQVIVNLAVNARDAMPDGGTLRIAVDADAGERAILTVEDDGSGMSAEVRERVLEPFFTTKPRERGTGLGLAIVHAIVTDHGGSLDIESAPAAGTRMIIRLPRRGVPQPDPVATAARRVASGRGERILVVEDNDQVRELVRDVLKSAGYRVATARDGQAAFDDLTAAGSLPDLLVVDLDLPRLAGGALLERLRERQLVVEAVVISGNVDAGRAAGDDARVAFLAKPFTIEALLALVAARLASSTGTRAGA